MRQTITKLAKNAFEVLGNLPRHGVGSKITRTSWQENSFWTVTQIKTETDGKRGKAYGILTWRGKDESEQPARIRGTSKKVWRTLSSDSAAASQQQRGSWPSLAAAALKAEEAAVDEMPSPSPPTSEEEAAETAPAATQ